MGITQSKCENKKSILHRGVSIGLAELQIRWKSSVCTSLCASGLHLFAIRQRVLVLDMNAWIDKIMPASPSQGRARWLVVLQPVCHLHTGALPESVFAWPLVPVFRYAHTRPGRARQCAQLSAPCCGMRPNLCATARQGNSLPQALRPRIHPSTCCCTLAVCVVIKEIQGNA